MTSTPTTRRLLGGVLGILLALDPSPTSAAEPSAAEPSAAEPDEPAPAEATAEHGDTRPTEEDAAPEGGSETEGAEAAEVESPAPDPNRTKAAALFREGTKFYELGKYDQAIDRFQRAWELAPEPPLLYNIGQAYWKWFDTEPKIDHLRQARVFFTNYDKRMRLTDFYDPREIEGIIQILDAKIEAEEAKAAERNRPVIVGPSLAEQEEAERRRLERERRLRVNRGLEGSGIALIVIGSLGLATGLAGLLVRQANKVILDNTTGGEAGQPTLASADEDRRRRNAFLTGGQVAFAGLIAGGVILPIGITLKVVGGQRSNKELKGPKGKREKATASVGPRLLTIHF